MTKTAEVSARAGRAIQPVIRALARAVGPIWKPAWRGILMVWLPIWALFRRVAKSTARVAWPILAPIGRLVARPFVWAWNRYLVVGADDPIPWRYALRRTYHGFLRHRHIDAAAALAFFSTLALFPGALAVISAVALKHTDGDAVNDILTIATLAIGPSAADAIRQPLLSLVSLSTPGVTLGIGIVLVVWSVSGYASAFGRAMNVVYGVQEGRRFYRFRSSMLLLSLVLVIAFAAMAAILLVTPSIAQAIGDQFQYGEPLVLIWNVFKWPLLVALVVVVVGLLYYFTPNIQHPQVRWVSYGALFAIGGWALATVGFAIYVVTFSHYDRVYGFLGGAVVLLVYTFISNLVLVLGGELDSQIIRVRYLQSGVEAEGLIPLPLRSSKRNLALARHQSLDMVDGRTIRLKAIRLYGEPQLDEQGLPVIRPRFQTMSGKPNPSFDEDPSGE
jgi:membrane protein